MRVELKRNFWDADGMFHNIQLRNPIELADDYLEPRPALDDRGRVMKGDDGKDIIITNELPSGAVILDGRAALPVQEIRHKPNGELAVYDQYTGERLPEKGPQVDTPVQNPDPTVPVKLDDEDAKDREAAAATAKTLADKPATPAAKK